MTDFPRPPAVAGTFYAPSGAELAHQVERCFLDPRGPGELPTRHRGPTRTLRAIVVPHAGFEFSGPIAAHAYSLLGAQRPPASVLILGVDHQGLGAGPVLSDRAWMTPLGPMETDHGLVQALSRGPVRVDEEAQSEEHSIEVQLPFLEYVLPHPKFVALQVRFDRFDRLLEVARVVADALRHRDVLLVASTDFSHYVPAQIAERLDRLAIDAILERDPRMLYETVRRNDISMCGIAPTTVLLAALAGEPLVARLLRWGHSGEAQPMREVVGYAALALETAPGAAPPVK
ncbi:MAG TPA: AmmeMemoRadiSam system protein B [Thermoplasmata archaeon]|nr:AmmeMemoRadiSam system protein B [Thermoplasmata archaeon]